MALIKAKLPEQTSLPGHCWLVKQPLIHILSMQTWLSPHCSLELQILLQIPFLQTSLGKQSWFELTHFEAQTPSEQRLPAPHCKLFLQAFTGISQLANGSPVIPRNWKEFLNNYVHNFFSTSKNSVACKFSRKSIIATSFNW